MRAPKSETTEFEKHPKGYATCVCTRLIDTGTHWNEAKQKYQRKLMIGFESEKLMQTGDYANEPFLLFSNFNYSMYQNSHLCKFIEDWRGKRFSSQDEADNFDLRKVLKQPAFVNVTHSDDGRYVNIQTIGPVPESMTAPVVKGKTIVIDQDDLDMAEVEKLSDRMKERVLNANERQGGTSKKSEATPTPTTGSTTETTAVPTSQTIDERNPPPSDAPQFKSAPQQANSIQEYDDDIPF